MATRLQIPNRLVAHEIGHGVASALATADSTEFAISRTADGALCTSRLPSVELEAQFATVLGGPLLDMMVDRTISGASEIRDVAAAVLHWQQEQHRPNANFAPDSDIVRSRRFARALDGGEQFTALQTAMGAASVAYRLYTDRPMELTMVARRLDGLDEGDALAFTGTQIADAAAGNEPLPQVAVDLHGWLAGTTERANDAMGVEAELIVRELNVRAT